MQASELGQPTRVILTLTFIDSETTPDMLGFDETTPCPV